MGVDPASYECGVAVVEDGKLVHTRAWKRDKAASLEDNLYSFSSFVNNDCHEHEVDVVGIEQVSVSFSMKTVRLIAYFEAAAAVGATLCGCECVWLKPSQARKLATGSGKGPKERVLAWARESLGGWEDARSLSADELEAYVIALAVEKLKAGAG